MNTSFADAPVLQQQAAPAYPAPAMRSSSHLSLFDENKMASMYRFAEIMAKGVATVPQHLRGNVGDCMAVAMAAQRWGMDPFVVAQKTHSVNGALGYEGQLVGALINTSSALKGRLNFRWFGDWQKIVGKFKWMESKTQKDKHGNPSRYAVPAWDSNVDEQGLGVVCFGTLVGEDEPRELEILMLQARTRNSTLWAEDPKQQIAYLAEKRWARLHMPEVLLGVYTPDELSAPRDMGWAEVVQPQPAGPSEDLMAQANTAADGGRAVFSAWWSKLLPAQRDVLRGEIDSLAKRTSEADKKRTFDNDAQPPASTPPAPTAAPAAAPTASTPRARAPAPKAPAPKPATAAAPTTAEPGFTAAYVRQRLSDAPDVDALYIAADLINAIDDVAAHPALNELFEELKGKFE